MANTYVVIDLETTGLDAKKEKIIEVAAVKVKRGLIIDEFSSLITIDKKISPEISTLTGITDDMLVNQPKIEDIIPALNDFIGSADIIAHNAQFDFGFLCKHWSDEREWIDSIVLAQIAFPSEPSYSLDWLSRSLEIDNNNAHRALSDALATANLCIQVEKVFSSLPDHIKEELSDLTNGDTSPQAMFISNRCKTNAPPAKSTKSQSHADKIPKRDINDQYRIPLDELASFLGADAIYRDRITDFEERPQQLHFSQEVGRTLNDGGCLLAEAGTGTGKSLAYLLPAALYTLGSGKQVAISTHTRNLQEQLIKNDVPMLSQLLHTNIKAAALKGRGNYLCKRLYKYFSQEPDDDYRYFLMRIAVWKASSNNCDSGELSLNGYTKRKWQRICACKENCAPFCPFRHSNTCFVQKARIQAGEADILILNHSLLIANAATESGFLPDLPHLVIDEAQHLEGATEDQLTTAIDFFDILNLTARYQRREKGKYIGVIPTLEKIEANIFEPMDHQRLEMNVAKLHKNINSIMETAEKFYNIIDEFFNKELKNALFYPVKIRILGEHRQTQIWQSILLLAEELAAALSELGANTFNVLDIAKAKLSDEEDQEKSLPKGFEELFTLGTTSRELAETIRACMDDQDDNYVAWVEYADRERRPAIVIAPIELSELLNVLLYEKTDSLILTSATLSIAKDFSYFKHRLGLDLLPYEPTEFTLPSPFFYREQALMAIVDDLPEWGKCSEIEATAAISETLIKLLIASKGRAIVLFTSHMQLKNVYHKIRETLKEKSISVLAHGISGSPSMLLERLKKEENCCILGAASFWEGVDVIGEALSLIVVVRLPFWPPNTPLAATRMERIEADGRSSFKDYSLPMALIRFKQGFGRLIRTDKDSGIFCVLDKRIITKRYGSSFTKTLPEMERVIGSSETVAAHIKKWLV